MSTRNGSPVGQQVTFSCFSDIDYDVVLPEVRRVFEQRGISTTSIVRPLRLARATFFLDTNLVCEARYPCVPHRTVCAEVYAHVDERV